MQGNIQEAQVNFFCREGFFPLRKIIQTFTVLSLHIFLWIISFMSNHKAYMQKVNNNIFNQACSKVTISVVSISGHFLQFIGQLFNSYCGEFSNYFYVRVIQQIVQETRILQEHARELIVYQLKFSLSKILHQRNVYLHMVNQCNLIF